ncbi:hypothetical protein [Homoserinibacter sp. GY 40078]|uniref:hypothetical protein n=1 Tax=Homoserinibacter sp. GY 40078 TaxID=2603275 RepID=UPI0011CA9ACB|nr:hypothetical protein [Homoserinibacter sp. GY 40078]TXK19095.1 hypothetical protein FVQ89_04010 [Homoserinibacter sp. GY 40078]
MPELKLTPSTFACRIHDNREKLTPLVRGAVIQRTAAFMVGGANDFRVVVECPGAGTKEDGAHPLTFSGKWSRE